MPGSLFSSRTHRPRGAPSDVSGLHIRAHCNRPLHSLAEVILILNVTADTVARAQLTGWISLLVFPQSLSPTSGVSLRHNSSTRWQNVWNLAIPGNRPPSRSQRTRSCNVERTRWNVVTDEDSMEQCGDNWVNIFLLLSCISRGCRSRLSTAARKTLLLPSSEMLVNITWLGRYQ
jgi:hypothetical protein